MIDLIAENRMLQNGRFVLHQRLQRGIHNVVSFTDETIARHLNAHMMNNIVLVVRHRQVARRRRRPKQKRTISTSRQHIDGFVRRHAIKPSLVFKVKNVAETTNQNLAQ